jgi:branched-chain amino acid transport system permease protein
MTMAVPATTPPVDDEPTVELVPEPGPGGRFRPTAAGWTGRAAFLAAVLTFVLWVPHAPFLAPSDSIDLSNAVIFAMIGISLNVLIGYTGTISLGHQAFVGIGAFTSAYVVTQMGQPFLVGVLAAAALGALQAMVLGGVALRITGLYFALVTLSYGLFAEDTLFNIQSLTGGGAGQEAPTPTGTGQFRAYYYVCLAFLAVVLWVDWRMMRSKGGRALLALRENPRVAATFGIDVKAFTVIGFAVSGAFAGIGGALFAHLNGRVTNVDFSFELALVFVIMTVVGGLRNRTGIVIGSAFFALLDLLLRKVPGVDSVLDHLAVTIPVVVLLAAVVVASRARRRGATVTVVAAVVVAVVAVGVLLPGHFPFVEARLESLPRLAPEIFRVVVGPILLLLTLTQFPGGIGQQVRPIQRWIRGERFSLEGGAEEEVQISDVRA